MMKLSLTIITVGLLTAACGLPAFAGQGGFFEGGTELIGWRMLLFGPVLCPITLAWLANIAWAESLRCLWTDRFLRMVIAAGIAVGFALLPLESLRHPNLELRVGYWLWLGSMAVLLVGSIGFAVWHRSVQGPASARPPSALDSDQDNE